MNEKGRGTQIQPNKFECHENACCLGIVKSLKVECAQQVIELNLFFSLSNVVFDMLLLQLIQLFTQI